MADFKRYGLYAIPEGAFLAAGSAWLGWNAATGQTVAHPDVPGLAGRADALTRGPRRYGFHGTIKPPFRLADGTDRAMLDLAVRDFCAGCAPVTVPDLHLRRLGGFVAITPVTALPALTDLAGRAVAALDRFRAPADAREMSRRRKPGLTARQAALLQRWGYPYVMDEFRFHLTLTGRCGDPDTVRDALAAHFAPVLPAPFRIDSLCLVGEAADGLFRLIRRYPLARADG